jgi:hypothetical protein
MSVRDRLFYVILVALILWALVGFFSGRKILNYVLFKNDRWEKITVWLQGLWMIGIALSIVLYVFGDYFNPPPEPVIAISNTSDPVGDAQQQLENSDPVYSHYH